MRNLSRGALAAFWLVLAAMIGLALFSLMRPAPEPEGLATQQARTVEAGVSARLTDVASGAPTPDLNATIEARANAELTATATLLPTATITPPPSVIDQTIGGSSFIGSIWAFFGRLGWLAQGLCCVLLPLLILVGIVNDPRRRA
jgi:hypothetical protein